MVKLRYLVLLSAMVAIQAMSLANAQRPNRRGDRDSDEDVEEKMNGDEIRNDNRKEFNSEADSNGRTGRQLSRFGQNSFDNQLGFDRFGSTNLLDSRNRLGSSNLLGSGNLNRLTTQEILDALQYNTHDGLEFGSRLNPALNPTSGLLNNVLSSSPLLGNSRLGANLPTNNNFRTGFPSSSVPSSQRLSNRPFLGTNQVGNRPSVNRQLVNTLRNQFTTSQRLGNQILTPEGVARTVIQDSQNDGFGQYSYRFETDNGIVQQQSGQPIGPDSYAVTGSYSYTSPEGELVTVRYIADENGFQVASPNIPPVPEHSRLQVLAAQRARNLGLIDINGNPTGLRTGFNNLRSNNRNILGTAGLGLNLNTGLASQSGLLNSGLRTSGLQNFNSLNNGFRSG